MKTKLLPIIVGLSGHGECSLADGFLNLDFESPNLSHATKYTSGTVIAPTSEALQGWRLVAETGAFSPINTYVSEVGAYGPLTLETGLTPQYISRHTGGIDFGKYSLYIGQDGPGAPLSYHLSQTGIVPIYANGLQYFCLGGSGSFRVTANGAAIAYKENDVGLGFADVSAYAGQQVKLEFVFPGGPATDFDITGFIATPEPSTYALLGIGGALLWWQGSRKPGLK